MLAGCGEGGLAGSVRSSQPASLLHEAVQAGRFKEARRSIADGAKLDAQDGNGFTRRISPLEGGRTLLSARALARVSMMSTQDSSGRNRAALAHGRRRHRICSRFADADAAHGASNDNGVISPAPAAAGGHVELMERRYCRV